MLASHILSLYLLARERRQGRETSSAISIVNTTNGCRRPMRLSKQPFQDRLLVPSDWAKTPVYKLLERGGFVHFPHAGFPAFLPLGQRLVNGIEAIIRAESERFGFDELSLPLLQD